MGPPLYVDGDDDGEGGSGVDRGGSRENCSVNNLHVNYLVVCND